MLGRLSWSACAVFLLATLPLRAQDDPGQSDPGLEPRLGRLCERLERERQDLHIAGMGFAVVKDGEVVLARGFGHRDLEGEVPATEHTLFAIGSTTKAFTSMLVAMLADEGKMAFDDPVSRHLPDFHLKNEVADGKVTLTDLLSHRTGLTRMSILWYGNGAGREAILRRVQEAELWAGFQSRFLYNNVMYLAAGVSAGKAADSDWDTLLTERILDPLGMTQTVSTGAASLAHPELSKGYAWDALKEDYTDRPFRNIDNCAPAGSITSSALDMTRWLRFLLAGGVWEGERLVSEEQFARLWKEENQAGPGVGYGLGWMLREWNGRRVIEHGGNIDGFSAAVALMPEEDLGFVLLTNVDAAGLQATSLPIVFEALVGEWKEEEAATASDIIVPGKPIPASDLGPYEGRYVFPLDKSMVTVAVINGRLTLDVPGQQVFLLNWPDAKGRWSFQIDPNIFVELAEPRGNWTDSVTIHQAGQKFECARERTEPDLPITIDDLLELRAERSGADLVADLEPFRLTGTVDFVHQGMQGKVTLVVDGDENARLDYDLGEFGSFTWGWNGGKAWTDSKAVGRNETDEKGSDALTWMHPLVLAGNWLDYCDEAEVERSDTVDNLPAIVVTVKPFEADLLTLFADPDHGRLLQVQGAGSPIPLGDPRLQFKDYREVDGVWLPFRWKVQNDSLGVTVVQFEQVETGVDLADGVFEVG